MSKQVGSLLSYFCDSRTALLSLLSIHQAGTGRYLPLPVSPLPLLSRRRRRRRRRLKKRRHQSIVLAAAFCKGDRSVLTWTAHPRFGSCPIRGKKTGGRGCLGREREAARERERESFRRSREVEREKTRGSDREKERSRERERKKEEEERISSRRPAAYVGETKPEGMEEARPLLPHHLHQNQEPLGQSA